MRLILFFFLLTLILSCQSNSNTDINELSSINEFEEGIWQVKMTFLNELGDSIYIPFKMEVDSGMNFTIVNHSERIPLHKTVLENDSIQLVVSRFDSEFMAHIDSRTHLSGIWHNKLRGDYTLHFVADYIKPTPVKENQTQENFKYDVSFSPATEDKYKAIGLFHKGSEYDYGTFLTETGDYRFLEGKIIDNSIKLSCFDGSHLFLFQGDVVADSIVNGQFFSGKHWNEPWEGVIRENTTLRDPDSLTFLKPGYKTVELAVQNLSGDSVFIDKTRYEDRVTIVQVFGSWCPNCYDENVFYKELYEEYGGLGLNIIPVAFEKGETFDIRAAYVEQQFNEIGVPYPAYIGGVIGKKIASEKFNMLNHIMSYPTSIFIDKKGEVRKIHTGFYGPSTGSYYSDYVLETKMFIEELLEEKVD